MRTRSLFFAPALLFAACTGDTTIDETTTIRGHVFDADTMTSLADARVTGTPQLGSVTTDAEGNFAFEGARFATLYQLRVERQGYQEATTTVTPTVRDEDPIEIGLSVVVACSPGTRMCVGGTDTPGIQTCSDRGDELLITDCPATQVCDPTTITCRATHTLTLTPPTGGTITSQPTGLSCGVSCEKAFIEGTTVTLRANAHGGASFTGWTGDCSGNEMTCDLTMTGPHTAGATFDDFSLTVERRGGGQGTVTSMPAGIDCGTTCSSQFDEDTMVTLTATPNAPSVFNGWAGDCAGNAPTCTVTIDGSKRAIARFAIPQFPLTVTLAGTGAGTVTSEPEGIDCGSECTADYDIDTMVTLTAEPANGSTFEGFAGACTGMTCTVTMDQARDVTATFDGISYPLAVTVGGTGGGTVTSMPGGINCNPTCTASYGPGAAITLTANPAPTSAFGGWSDACAAAGTNLTCDVTMDMALTVGAQFDIVAQALTVAVTGNGRITSTPVGIDCPGDCDEAFPTGTMVTLLAAPNAGSGFAAWQGACAGSGASCQLTVNAGTMATAAFLPLTQLPLPVDGNCTALFHFDGAQPYTSACGGGGPAAITGTYASVASRNTYLMNALDAGGATEEAWIDTASNAPAPPNATIELTVRKDGPAFDGRGRGALFCDHDTLDPNRVGFCMVVADDGMLIAQTRNAAQQTTTASSAVGRLTNGAWYHVGATISSAGGLALFVDGTEVARVAGAPNWTASSSTAWVGAAREGAGAIQRLDGTIDEVRVSDVVRY